MFEWTENTNIGCIEKRCKLTIIIIYKNIKILKITWYQYKKNICKILIMWKTKITLGSNSNNIIFLFNSLKMVYNMINSWS